MIECRVKPALSEERETSGRSNAILERLFSLRWAAERVSKTRLGRRYRDRREKACGVRLNAYSELLRNGSLNVGIAIWHYFSI